MTGLDYFGARYMRSAQGRFTSPDPYVIQFAARKFQRTKSRISRSRRLQSNESRNDRTKLTFLTGILGLLVGFVMSAYAHSGNGFESGPIVLLALIVSILGGLVSVEG